MKMKRPALAGLLALAAASAPHAALVKTIDVTTFEDDFGENRSTCSLREAVEAVTLKAPFGGCPAGSAFDRNQLQLKPGVYTLSRGELIVRDTITVVGADSQQEAHEEQKNPLTGLAPRRFRPDYRDSDPLIGATGTYITSAPGSRVFYTEAVLTLRDVVLNGSASAAQASPGPVTGNGGVIYAGAALALDNVVIRGGHATGLAGSRAAGNGGAIYLSGEGSELSIGDSTLEGNQATNKGGAVAMLCSADLNTYVQHSVGMARSLLRANTSGTGAGAIELCGNTAAQISHSTFSANTSAAASGAIAYVQGSAVETGSLTLSYVTAAENNGHILAANGLASIRLLASLMSAFEMSPRADVCHNPDGAVAWATNIVGGTYNAIDADGSCADLLEATGENISIPVGTALSGVLVPIRPMGDYTGTPGGAPYGLTDYYLPRLTATPAGATLTDLAQPLSSCSGTDQRGVPRDIGAACDIGAVERLIATARDDDGFNEANTNRLAIIDVLANDSFGEDDVSGPFTFAANTALDPAVVLEPGGDGGGRCAWKLADDADNPGRLVVTNFGALTSDAAPVVCTYRVVDSGSGPSDTVASVRVDFRNAPPNANADSYLRPVGQSTVVFDPLENDDDKGDGKYGLVDTGVLDPASPGENIYGPETAWADFYPIEIVGDPALGQVLGESGVCPGSDTVPRICLKPPLRYEADNNMSPFSDTFTYKVYDKDGSASAAATVTIFTDAPDPDHGGGAGSWDILGGLVLGLLGLRRFRKL